MPSSLSSRCLLLNNFLPDIQLDEQGEGPVHLIGSHCIDFFASMDGEAEDEEDEDDEMEVGERVFYSFLVLRLSGRKTK